MASKPILYYATLSPPARSVLFVAKEIGIELDLRPINLLNNDHLTPEFLKMNPQHTIPVLNDNGVVVYDSHVISGYLSDKHGKTDRLYPKDMIKRTQVDARLHFDTGFLFARLRFIFEPVLFFGCTEIPQSKIDYVEKCYEIMEAFLKDTPYLCGQEMTIADLCCIATISTGFSLAPVHPREYKKLTEWIERMKALPYYDELNAGAEEVQQILRNKMQENQLKQL